MVEPDEIVQKPVEEAPGEDKRKWSCMTCAECHPVATKQTVAKPKTCIAH